jgi:hypothetical protein
MATLCTPLRIYNTSNDPSKKNRKAKLDAAVTRVNKDRKVRHWRQYTPEPMEMRTHNFAMSPHTADTECVRQLREQVRLYKNATRKMKTLALWNLRSTKSALKDVQEMIDVIEDLYGDSAFDEFEENLPPK